MKLDLHFVGFYSNNKEKYPLNNFGRLNLTKCPKKILKCYYQKQSKMLLKCQTKPFVKKNRTLFGWNSIEKKEKTKLQYNRQLAVSRLNSLENKFEKELGFSQKYQETTENYLKNCYAAKLNNKQCDENKEFANCIPHHMNKVGLFKQTK